MSFFCKGLEKGEKGRISPECIVKIPEVGWGSWPPARKELTSHCVNFKSSFIWLCE